MTDARNISILVQHSLVKMPDNNFKPRKDDTRVGYFTTQTNNMTSLDRVNYRDFINRWRLEKKNPELEISEPITPIVYWVENTTPIELREIVKNAIESWNSSFEKAGFKNAIVAKFNLILLIGMLEILDIMFYVGTLLTTSVYGYGPLLLILELAKFLALI